MLSTASSTDPRDNTLWTTFRRLQPGWTVLLFPLVVWIWLCWDWPEELGFYSDDWMILLHPFVGSAKAFRDIFSLISTRPASVPFVWLAQLIADWSPARSQYLNAAMLLATALSVGALASTLSSIAGTARQSALVGACFAAITFIVFPSNVGTFAWSVGMLAVVPAVPLFCLAMSLLLRSEGNAWRLGFSLPGIDLALIVRGVLLSGGDCNSFRLGFERQKIQRRNMATSGDRDRPQHWLRLL